jgi:hypothetical protein
MYTQNLIETMTPHGRKTAKYQDAFEDDMGKALVS